MIVQVVVTTPDTRSVGDLIELSIIDDGDLRWFVPTIPTNTKMLCSSEEYKTVMDQSVWIAVGDGALS